MKSPYGMVWRAQGHLPPHTAAAAAREHNLYKLQCSDKAPTIAVKMSSGRGGCSESIYELLSRDLMSADTPTAGNNHIAEPMPMGAEVLPARLVCTFCGDVLLIICAPSMK